MAVDLFFVAKKLDWDTVRAKDFDPTVSQLRAQRKLITALIERFPGTALVGDERRGYLQGFPLGELIIHPGYLHWSLHGVDDTDPVFEVIEWFESKSVLCEDPQDAGFGNRLKPGQKRAEPLDDFDALIDARLLGVSTYDNREDSLLLRFLMRDGREAEIAFVHLANCFLPNDLRAAFFDRIVEITTTPTQITMNNGESFAMSDDFHFVFRIVGEIYCRHAVIHKFQARAP